jgi:DNA-binding PadR family transcriptional regulator
MNAERLKGNLDLLLLSVVAAGPAHGYAVIERLRQSSNGTFDLPEGTVYPALHRLEEAGRLMSEWDRSGPRPRRVYRISADGQAALATERIAWESFSGSVNSVIGGPVWNSR